jgi:hypothetical protein
MKKTSLLLFLCILFYTGTAQQMLADQSFKEYSADMSSKLSALSKKKEYPESIKMINGWIKTYKEQNSKTQVEYKTYLPGMYYNLACYQSLTNDTAYALHSLQMAVDLGYNNYNHTLTDTDLDNLRNSKQFIAALQQLREKGDFIYILKNAGPYQQSAYPTAPAMFSYQRQDEPDLATFRKRYKLDSVSGNGDEISKIKNLLTWVHNMVRHDGSSNNPNVKNGTALIEVCKKEDRGVNCRMLATILKDAYQAEGFPSRAVTCLPKDTADFDCHVINMVWSYTLNKWLWMDPTNNAYISDDKGNLLSIQEVRARLIEQKPLVVNPDANWNNKSKVIKEEYLDQYMAKNLFWIQCPLKSEWDLETVKKDKPAVEYISLYPDHFNTLGGKAVQRNQYNVMYASGNEKEFWAAPIK